jgi:uncharacterized membrane protein YcaP (DUF421 family)
VGMPSHIDWQAVFVPSLHVGEIILRGTIVYLFLFAVLRALRRQVGAIGITDVLVVVLVADAAQNAMAADYKSITEGLILVSTIIFWDVFLNWLDFKLPIFRQFLTPPALPLIMDGRLQWQNLRKQLITKEELMAKLREHGVERLDQVKESYLEPDGNVSVITKDEKPAITNPEKKLIG